MDSPAAPVAPLRRWGTRRGTDAVVRRWSQNTTAETGTSGDPSDGNSDQELLYGPLPCAQPTPGARAVDPRALGAQFAAELFHPNRAQGILSCQNKADLASVIGETTRVHTTPKLRWDFTTLAEGGAVYWPSCICTADDLSLFHQLYEELSPWKASPYKRSKHPACVDEKQLLASKTYRRIVAQLRNLFGIAVGYSIVNLYADGDDWTDYHRDNYKADGNRMAQNGANTTDAAAHEVTVGVSLGDSRELRFKHLETGLEFAFPQSNGDVFAFTEPVNSAFQHGVPRGTRRCGPRISVILWGRLVEGTSLLRKPGKATDGAGSVQECRVP
eukprot:s587_g3.t1